MAVRVAEVWVVDRDFRVADEDEDVRCAFHGANCQNRAVAFLCRIAVKGKQREEALCAEHLYGRWVVDGVVRQAVPVGSFSALRGWTSMYDSTAPIVTPPFKLPVL